MALGGPAARQLDAIFATAARTTSVVAACTPENFRSEVKACAEAYRRGRPRDFRFRYYRPPDVTRLRRAIASMIEGSALVDDPAGPLYRRRLEELDLELRICAQANQDDFAALASERFPIGPSTASELSDQWARLTGNDEPKLRCRSCDPHAAESLLSQMRAAVGAAHLPFRVVATSKLAAIAATGPNVIYVIADQHLSQNATRRTVLHEVVGHAQVRANSAACGHTILRHGTARGSDHQEGRALCLEDEFGFMGVGRKRELAARHLAGVAVREGEDSVATKRRLVRDFGYEVEDAVRVVARGWRGGGLARELTYLPSFLTVKAARVYAPNVEAMQALGAIAVEDAPDVEKLLSRAPESQRAARHDWRPRWPSTMHKV